MQQESDRGHGQRYKLDRSFTLDCFHLFPTDRLGEGIVYR